MKKPTQAQLKQKELRARLNAIKGLTRRVKDYPGYGVTAEGKVYNLKTGREIKSHGIFPGLALMKNGERVFHYVARLVAQAYLPNPENYDEVGYYDGNRSNVKSVNLRWQADSFSHAIQPVSTKVKTGKIVGSAFLAKRGVYEVYIQRKGIKRYLGVFQNVEDAQGAYNAASKLYLENPAAFAQLRSPNPSPADAKKKQAPAEAVAESVS